MDLYVVGSCEDMCPLAEALERASHPAVCEAAFNPPIFVKRYVRPVAGAERALANEVRPFNVLCATVRHLLLRVVGQSGLPLADTAEYVSDRLRAVRQDARIQGLRGSHVVRLHLTAARFHSVIAYSLLASGVGFDAVRNDSMLVDALDAADDAADIKHSDSTVDMVPLLAELSAYRLTLSTLETAEIITTLRAMPAVVAQHNYVRKALIVPCAWHAGRDERILAAVEFRDTFQHTTGIFEPGSRPGFFASGSTCGVHLVVRYLSHRFISLARVRLLRSIILSSSKTALLPMQDVVALLYPTHATAIAVAATRRLCLAFGLELWCSRKGCQPETRVVSIADVRHGDDDVYFVRASRNVQIDYRAVDAAVRVAMQPSLSPQLAVLDAECIALLCTELLDA